MSESIGIDLAFQGFEQELAGLPGGNAPKEGRLLVARLGGVAAETVGVRRLDVAVCEMQRLYRRPPFRATGLDPRLDGAAIEEARRGGYLTEFRPLDLSPGRG